MAGPAPVEDSGPVPWWAPLIGLVFALAVLGFVGVATVSSENTHDQKAEHSDDHSDDSHSDDG